MGKRQWLIDYMNIWNSEGPFTTKKQRSQRIFRPSLFRTL